MTAAWNSAAAVPLVHSATDGTPRDRAAPRAMNDAPRSSMCTCTSMRGCAASANPMGVERDPGAMNAARTPQRTHSSTRVAQNVAAAVTAIGAYLGRMGLAVEHLGDAKHPRLVLVHGFTQTGRSWS